MKTTCPNCSASYRVEDTKVPTRGAQIKCPRCGTVFVVMRLSAKETPPQPPPAPLEAQPAQPPPLPENSAHQNQTNAMPIESKPSGHSEHVVNRARGISAIRAQSGIAPPALSAGTDSLHGASDLAAALESAQPMLDSMTGVPKTRQKAGVGMYSAVLLTFLLLVIGVVITVTRYGIWDLSLYLPLQEIGIMPPRPVVEKTERHVDIGKTDPEIVYMKAIAEGADALQVKDFSKAALEYNRALSVRPGSREALDGLAKAYEGLGDREQALRSLKPAASTEAKPTGSQEKVP